jgi:formate-dependent nitrite reductase membrane component NrfD
VDPFVASPEWGGWIVAYFYLGGIAAGAYAVAAMVGLWGDEDDRRALRVADYVAFPLVCLCGLILTVDLGRPERFWHMMVGSETFRPMLKWWSPMSAGSWGLSAFGALSCCSFVGALAEDGRFGLGRFSALAERLRRGPAGRAFGAAGTAAAFFLGAYTGTLLSASNQPVWADTSWLAALFLASALATGVAALVLLVRWQRPGTTPGVVERLERVDAWAAILELAMLAAFAASLGPLALPAFGSWPGALIPAVVVPAGILFPLAARLARRRGRFWGMASAVSVLAAGLALRYAVVGMPGPFRVGS